MAQSFELLEQLMPLIKEYAQSETESDVKGFVDFLHSRTLPPSEHLLVPPSSEHSAIEVMHREDGPYAAEAAIAFHLSRLNRYAKYYIKDALKNSSLVNGDDFGFLASVIEKRTISKSDLITYAVFEVSSGIEVIKRLVRNGLISEQVSAEDRRVKMLAPTEKGMAVFFESLEQMKKVGGIVSAKLQPGEKSQLAETLKKLDHFHENIYNTSDTYDIETILAKYVIDQPV